MRLYVNCQDHPEEKIYIQFRGDEPQHRNDIALSVFRVRCSITGEYNQYTSDDVIAEEGAQLPIAGAVLGALLFFVNPIAGLIGTIAGGVGGKISEEEKVNTFNGSRAQ